MKCPKCQPRLNRGQENIEKQRDRITNNMPVEAKYGKLWNLKAFILAFQIAFCLCFFVGIFNNSYNIAPTFTDNKWFYINRGYPVAWAGQTVSKLPVDFPIIKAPFLITKIEENSFQKIIDLKIFLPLFLSVLIIAYPVTFIFSKAAEENTSLNIILIPVFIILTIICIFSYFFWFPRI